VFERYTEKVRRTIFFARYEASHYGSPYIESEHLLLGLLREYRDLPRMMGAGSIETIRKRIDASTESRPSTSTSVDLPLSTECKRVLAYAAEEAERLAHKYIGSEHLVLGLLREKSCFGAELLRERGLTLEQLRLEFAKAPSDAESHRRIVKLRQIPLEVHGFAMDAEYIRDRFQGLRKLNWHWHRKPWKARDLAVSKDGRISFDVSLTADAQNFDLKQGGWKQDRCAICRWELFESDDKPDHSIGYTNGRDWVCTECYEKFLSGPDFFATTHPEIT
jgi:hypothetical protein